MTAPQAEELAALVSAESPSDDLQATAACARVAAQIGTARLGRPPEELQSAGRLHLRWRFGAQCRVLLLGHLDTVWPLGTLGRWPFDVEGDRATGPGVFDMKAGVVQLLAAASMLDDPDGAWVLLTSDEEVGSAAAQPLIADAVRGAAAVLVFEPSADGALKTARKGVAQYTVRVTGRAAHAGLEPERGVNAAVEAAHQVLSAAAVAVDVRTATLAEQERVSQALRGLGPVVPGAAVEVIQGMRVPPLQAESSRELFALAGQAAADLGLPPLRGVAVGGGSDGNFTAAL